MKKRALSLGGEWRVQIKSSRSRNFRWPVELRVSKG
jgi:hypothetical protein